MGTQSIRRVSRPRNGLAENCFRRVCTRRCRKRMQDYIVVHCDKYFHGQTGFVFYYTIRITLLHASRVVGLMRHALRALKRQLEYSSAR